MFCSRDCNCRLYSDLFVEELTGLGGQRHSWSRCVCAGCCPGWCLQNELTYSHPLCSYHQHIVWCVCTIDAHCHRFQTSQSTAFRSAQLNSYRPRGSTRRLTSSGLDRRRPCRGEHHGTTTTIGHSLVGLVVLVGPVTNGKNPLGVGSGISVRNQSPTSRSGQTYPMSPHWD